MQNTKTKTVYDYWTGLKGDRPAPARRDVSPRGLRATLPFVFIAERLEPDLTVFRLAGTGLCERYGRELRDHSIEAIWSHADRPAVRELIDRVLTKPAPGLIAFRAETVDRRGITGEMLLLPLSDDQTPPDHQYHEGFASGMHTGQTCRKLLGCAFATQSTASLGQRPLVHQTVVSARLLQDGEPLLHAIPPSAAGAVTGPLNRAGPHPSPQPHIAVNQPQNTLAPAKRTGAPNHLRLVVSNDWIEDADPGQSQESCSRA